MPTAQVEDPSRYNISFDPAGKIVTARIPNYSALFIETYTDYTATFKSCYLRCDDEIRHEILTSVPPQPGVYCWKESACDAKWMEISIHFNKTLDTLYLESDRVEKVRQLLQSFAIRKGDFEKRGIPHKLSILAEGPPGTGKSSLIKAIVNEIGADLFIVNLAGIERIDALVASFIRIRGRLQDRTAVLAFEDIHRIDPKIFSQLYGFLDGVFELNNCILILTSNVPHDKLDPTLIRGGRVNYTMKFGYLSKENAMRMCKAIVPHYSYDAQLKISSIVVTTGPQVSPALFESLLLQYSMEPDEKLIMQNYSTIRTQHEFDCLAI